MHALDIPPVAYQCLVHYMLEHSENSKHTADMDTSQKGQMFTVTLENFGEEGTLVKGAFSGMLKGDDGKLHAVEEGKFSIRRKNAKLIV